MLHNQKLSSIVTELFIRGRKLDISLVFVTQLYFAVPKDIRLSSTPHFILKIPNKQELQRIASIINEIMILRTLYTFTPNVLQNHIPF